MLRSELEVYLAELLSIDGFLDYCPNGLQVEGRAHVNKILTGVTASQALINHAIEIQADAILVHHGYFWKGENAVITHVKKQRIKSLLVNDLSLFAYHLPLDTHPDFGNNVRLAKHLGLTKISSLKGPDQQDLVLVCELEQPPSLEQFASVVSKRLQRQVQVLGTLEKRICKVALCTGAAQNMFENVIQDHHIDAYLTGEVSESCFHLANEYGVGFIAAGHHATERYGIQALGEHLQNRFGLEHVFADFYNPV